MENSVNFTGSIPETRFGHSITQISPTDYFLFGGAIGNAGSYEITSDAYILNLNALSSTKLSIQNDIGPRAAHSVTVIKEYQVILFGGATGGGSLATEELYVLDLTSPKQSLQWEIVPVSGVTPGRRYGHTLVFHKPHLILFGGNNGLTTLNDLWTLDVQTIPFTWKKVEFSGIVLPQPRVYHTTAICPQGSAQNMIVSFGGRDNEGQSLNDIWGLRKHRNGNWDWVQAPIKRGSMPEPRFQHASVFYRTYLIIVGGRELNIGRPLYTGIYDTEKCEWTNLSCMPRFRHAVLLYKSKIVTFGGFEHASQNQPKAGFSVVDLNLLLKQPLSSSLAITPSQVNSITVTNLSSVNSHPVSSAAQSVSLANHVISIIDSTSDPSSIFKKIPIEDLKDEGRKIKCINTPLDKNYSLGKIAKCNKLSLSIFEKLMHPELTLEQVNRYYNTQDQFVIPKENILQLIKECTLLYSNEESLIKLRAPIKGKSLGISIFSIW